MANTYATGKHGDLVLNGTEYSFESWTLTATIETDTVSNNQDWFMDTNPTGAYAVLEGTWRGEQPEIHAAIFQNGFRPLPKEDLNFRAITPEQAHTGSHIVPTEKSIDASSDETLTDDFSLRIDRPDWQEGGNGRREIAVGPSAVES